MQLSIDGYFPFCFDECMRVCMLLCCISKNVWVESGISTCVLLFDFFSRWTLFATYRLNDFLSYICAPYSR